MYAGSQLQNAILAMDKGNCRSFLTVDFEHRFHLMKQELRESDSDIISLCEMDHSEEFVSFLEGLGYSHCLQETKRRLDYTTGLLAFKKDKFCLEKYMELDFLQLRKVYKEEVYMQHGFVVLLRHLETNMLFVVVSAHYLWEPKYDYMKFAQSLLILQKIDEMTLWAKENMAECFEVNLPTIILGDLNSKTGSSVIHMYTGRGLEYNHAEDLDPSLLEFSGRAKGLAKRVKYYKEIQDKLG